MKLNKYSVIFLGVAVGYFLWKRKPSQDTIAGTGIIDTETISNKTSIESGLSNIQLARADKLALAWKLYGTLNVVPKTPNYGWIYCVPKAYKTSSIQNPLDFILFPVRKITEKIAPEKLAATRALNDQEELKFKQVAAASGIQTVVFYAYPLDATGKQKTDDYGQPFKTFKLQ